MHDSIVVPAWADRIEVSELPKSLLVTGEGRLAAAVAFSSSVPPGSKGLLNKYIPMIEVGRKQGTVPPHLEFAEAKNQKHQIAFVKKYGPVWGNVIEMEEPRIVVEQRMEALEREQRIFSIVARMIVEVRREPKPNIQQLELLSLLLLSEGFDTFAPASDREAILDSMWNQQGIPTDFVAKPGSNELRRMAEQFFTYRAHWMIGIAADRFPPQLNYFAGRPAELPPHRVEGILPVLYFMLRKDYLATDKRIGLCANTNCRKLFSIEKVRQIFCSPECSALQRGRDYWHKAGKKRRAERVKAKHS